MAEQPELFETGKTGKRQRKPDHRPPIPTGEWKRPRSWYELLHATTEIQVCGLYSWHKCKRVVPARGKVRGEISEADLNDSGCVAVLDNGNRMAVGTPRAFIVREAPKKKIYEVTG